MEIPTIGDTIVSQLGNGSSLAENIIYEIQDSPRGNKKGVTFHHTALPSIPWTTSRRLEEPLNHLVHTTVILIPIDPINFPLPSFGQTISALPYLSGVAEARQDDIITNESHPEAYGGYRLEIEHMLVPAGQYEEWESIAYTFPAIYNISRQRQRVVPARVIYEYTADPGPLGDDWLAAPTIWDYADPTTGPFEISSVIQEAAGTNFTDGEGASGLVGDFLNSTFITQDTLNDAISIYSPGDLAYEIAASVPSATTYLEWFEAKTEFITSRTIHTWRGTLYMRRTVYVRAQ